MMGWGYLHLPPGCACDETSDGMSSLWSSTAGLFLFIDSNACIVCSQNTVGIAFIQIKISYINYHVIRYQSLEAIILEATYLPLDLYTLLKASQEEKKRDNKTGRSLAEGVQRECASWQTGEAIKQASFPEDRESRSKATGKLHGLTRCMS